MLTLLSLDARSPRDPRRARVGLSALRRGA